MIRLPKLLTRAALTAGACAALAVPALAGASAASAAPLSPEFFTISFPAAAGVAYGPVHGAFSDNEVSTTSGIWTFEHSGAVRVDHTAVRTPVINRFSCTGFLYQRGQWQMTGLYGAYRHAFGFGRFTLTERIQVGRHHHSCDPADVISETVNVTGSGLAANH